MRNLIALALVLSTSACSVVGRQTENDWLGPDIEPVAHTDTTLPCDVEFRTKDCTMKLIQQSIARQQKLAKTHCPAYSETELGRLLKSANSTTNPDMLDVVYDDEWNRGCFLVYSREYIDKPDYLPMAESSICEHTWYIGFERGPNGPVWTRDGLTWGCKGYFD